MNANNSMVTFPTGKVLLGQFIYAATGERKLAITSMEAVRHMSDKRAEELKHLKARLQRAGELLAGGKGPQTDTLLKLLTSLEETSDKLQSTALSFHKDYLLCKALDDLEVSNDHEHLTEGSVPPYGVMTLTAYEAYAASLKNPNSPSALLVLHQAIKWWQLLGKKLSYVRGGADRLVEELECEYKTVVDVSSKLLSCIEVSFAGSSGTDIELFSSLMVLICAPQIGAFGAGYVQQ